jgi:hypothetical protein
MASKRVRSTTSPGSLSKSNPAVNSDSLRVTAIISGTPGPGITGRVDIEQSLRDQSS